MICVYITYVHTWNFSGFETMALTLDSFESQLLGSDRAKSFFAGRFRPGNMLHGKSA